MKIPKPQLLHPPRLEEGWKGGQNTKSQEFKVKNPKSQFWEWKNSSYFLPIFRSQYHENPKVPVTPMLEEGGNGGLTTQIPRVTDLRTEKFQYNTFHPFLDILYPKYHKNPKIPDHFPWKSQIPEIDFPPTWEIVGYFAISNPSPAVVAITTEGRVEACPYTHPRCEYWKIQEHSIILIQKFVTFYVKCHFRALLGKLSIWFLMWMKLWSFWWLI